MKKIVALSLFIACAQAFAQSETYLPFSDNFDMYNTPKTFQTPENSSFPYYPTAKDISYNNRQNPVFHSSSYPFHPSSYPFHPSMQPMVSAKRQPFFWFINSLTIAVPIVGVGVAYFRGELDSQGTGGPIALVSALFISGLLGLIETGIAIRQRFNRE